MHGGLLCQTDETPDARDLYAAKLESCEDCAIAGEIISLVQAALGGDDALEIRRRPPVSATRRPERARSAP